MIYQFVIGSSIRAVRANDIIEALRTISRAFAGSTYSQLTQAPNYEAPSMGNAHVYDAIIERIEYAGSKYEMIAAQERQPKVVLLKTRTLNKERAQNRLLKMAYAQLKKAGQ